jgi:hypothetical protein
MAKDAFKIRAYEVSKFFIRRFPGAGKQVKTEAHFESTR